MTTTSLHELPSGATDPGPPAGMLPRRLFVPALGLMSMVTPVATDLWLPAFPEIAADLDVPASSVQLTITTLLVGLAVGQLVLGPLSDRYGRRTPMIVGSIGCALSTAVIALAPTIELLLAARVVQGLTGAAGVVLSRAMIADVWSGSRAAKNLSLLAVVITLAPVVAPVVGGVLGEVVGWRGLVWLFFALTLLMVLTACLLPETHPVRRRDAHRIAPAPTGPVGPGGALSLLGRTPFVAAMLVVGLAHMCLLAYISAAPLVYRGVLGLGPAAAGTVFALCAASLVLMNLVSSATVVRHGPRRVLRVGLTMLGTGGVLLLLVALALVPAWAVLVPVVLVVGSIGLVAGNGTALAVDRARPMVGRASGLIGFTQSLLSGAVAPVLGLWPSHVVAVLGVVVTTGAALAWALHLVSVRPAQP